jgi:hypothetical protein
MAITKKSRSRRTRTSAEILARIIRPERADLSPEAARAILRFRFSPADLARYERLSSRVQDETFTSAEREELEEYVRVADLLAMLKVKADLSLKRAESSPGAS